MVFLLHLAPLLYRREIYLNWFIYLYWTDFLESDPIPGIHKHLQNCEFLVGQSFRHYMPRGEKGLKSERRHVYMRWAGFLHVQRPCGWRSLSSFRGGAFTAVCSANTHALCNVLPNRGFFQCAGEEKCSEVWKPDTRIVKSSSNGPCDPGGGTWKMSWYCSSPPFSYQCVQFEGIRF